VNFFIKIRDRNYDLPVYFLLVLLYGLGWDLAVDNTLQFWSVIGVISYTSFIVIFMVRTRRRERAQTSSKPAVAQPKHDLFIKLALAVLLYGLLVFKLIQNMTKIK